MGWGKEGWGEGSASLASHVIGKSLPVAGKPPGGLVGEPSTGGI